jgi:hypothetical protein
VKINRGEKYCDMMPERENSGDRNTAVTREWLCKYVSMASYMTVVTITHAPIDEPLEAVFSVGSIQWLYSHQESLQECMDLEETEVEITVLAKTSRNVTDRPIDRPSHSEPEVVVRQHPCRRRGKQRIPHCWHTLRSNDY